MPVRLQLEGHDLEALLERVQEEYGERARIVEAEKLRTGGLGGFFAKESFAMTVELDESAAGSAGSAPLPRVPDDASSLLDLVDEVDRTEVSTSSEAFGEVLARLSEATGDDFVVATPPPAVANRRARAAFAAGGATTATAPGTPAQRRARPALPPARTLAAPAPRTPEPAAPAEVVPAVFPTAAATASTVRTSAARPTATTPTAARKAAARRAEPAEKAKAATKTTIKTATRTATTRSAMPGTKAATTSAARPAARRTTAAPVPAAPRRTPATPSRRAPSTASRLLALGLPEHLVPARPTDLHRALSTCLAALPVAPEPALHPGGVLLVIGPAEAALTAARAVSVELDLDPTAVVLCAPEGLLGLVPARQRGASARKLTVAVETAARRLRPLVVAVDERLADPATAGRHGWATAVPGLFPSAVRWGVASATTKAGDVDRWAARVGGVDGLWLEDVVDSADPATALASTVPVARLDGRPATPGAWASLLCERLA